MTKKKILSRVTMAVGALAIAFGLGAPGAYALAEESPPSIPSSQLTVNQVEPQGLTDAFCETWLGLVAPKAVCGDNG